MYNIVRVVQEASNEHWHENTTDTILNTTIDLQGNSAVFQWRPSAEEMLPKGIHSVSGIRTSHAMFIRFLTATTYTIPETTYTTETSPFRLYVCVVHRLLSPALEKFGEPK